MPRALRLVLCFVAIAAMQSIVMAQVLYKWTDKDGRVQYSDTPPKNFQGPVTRIEPDTPPTPTPALSGAGAAEAGKGNDGTRALIDMAAKKRAARDKLEANLVAARARLASAKAALDNATPGNDERQVIQQKFDQVNPIPGPGSSSTGGMLGMGASLGATKRSNCTTSTNSPNNAPVTVCPTVLPNGAYYDRVKQLQDAVSSAEDDVAAAEQAYRRGVD